MKPLISSFFTSNMTYILQRIPATLQISDGPLMIELVFVETYVYFNSKEKPSKCLVSVWPYTV
jgi:hypothetical protein